MKHSHPDGVVPEEIGAFADAMFQNANSLAQITKAGPEAVEFRPEVPIARAELNYTTNSGRWHDRNWESIPASIDTASKTVKAAVPSGTTAWYFNLFDSRGFVVSS
jgi:hypothetical protein